MAICHHHGPRDLPWFQRLPVGGGAVDVLISSVLQTAPDALPCAQPRGSAVCKHNLVVTLETAT